MFEGLSRLIERRPRRLLIVVGVLVLVALGIGGSSLSKMTMGLDDYDDQSSSSVKVLKDVEQATGADLEQGYVVLVKTDHPIDPHSLQRPEVVQRAIDVLKERPEVKSVMDYASLKDSRMLAGDGEETYLVATVSSFKPGDAPKKAVNALLAAIDDDPELKNSVTLGGPTAANVEGSDMSSKDLGEAESIGFPILLILLLFIFRGVVAALIPLGGAICAVSVSLGLMGMVMTTVHVSVFALNLVLALGIGLSIDFSLLVISRFREELSRGLSTVEALDRTRATAGRTVLFSGMTVAAALASLLVFPQRFLYSMGIAGITTTLGALFFALIGLPALLSALGPRINTWSPKRWQRAAEAPEERGRWYRFSQGVMKRPVSVAIGAGAVLILLGVPFLGIKFTGIDSASMPEDSKAGTVYQTLDKNFPGSLQSPAYLIHKGPSDAGPELAEYAESLGKIDGVAAVAPPRKLSDGLWETDVSLKQAPLSLDAQHTLKEIKNAKAPYPTVATGNTALFRAMQDSIGSHLPVAIAITVVTTLLILFAMTGSVILPLKAAITNLLTLSATFGILVLIFQNGYLAGLLDFHSQGALQPTMLVILFALALGVSTDYSVFLLSRIKEGVELGVPNGEAVATGLQKVGRITTFAALLFCIPLGALTLSRLVFIKQLGLGTALAVIIDATLVRALLVPSLMALFGNSNWWSPGPLRRFHTRFFSGFRESEAPSAPATMGATSGTLR
ncbi:MMPL family transporter [Streptomyces sp. NBC_01481]|uniref:MMPL family transporter n=1 Tax=Streptomyces sp. NBC_01481 TaxID=2975869 RepID=UPI00225097C5|nr:MMPL family transporter [Streptomyces sp. NBC_01481]MCX4588126.1 MMPL family transporter [Streptomyces sp. NBC_01481]